MLTFLFWNMGGDLPKSAKPQVRKDRADRLRASVGNLARVHNIDVFIVAECPLNDDEVIYSLNTNNLIPYHKNDPDSLCTWIRIYPRFPSQYLSRHGGAEAVRYTFRHITLPAREPILLVAAHLRSKGKQSDDSQTLGAPGFSQKIRNVEEKAKHQRTILVGDLNLHPFDAAMVGGQGINAVMTKEIAQRETRVIDGEAYPYFYNPMWSHFGDSSHEEWPPGHPSHEPPGTCYFGAAESKWYYWSMLDQVLLRPVLVPAFKNKELRILTSDGTISFLDHRGLPKKDIASDHLPIRFRLNI